MKLLLVLGADDNFDIISGSLRPMGFELIRYRHVLKAMDNIDEINPRAIIISARDFPRHWKILVQFVRSERSKEVCPIIILKGMNFSTEETSKAFFLGVNGIVDDTLDNPRTIDQLQDIISCHVPVNEKRKQQRFHVEPWHRVGFLAADFPGKTIVTGEVINICTGGLSFHPSDSISIEGPALSKELRECSLRAGDAILSPVCHVVRAGKTFSVEFVSFTDDDQRILYQFLEEFPVMEFGNRKVS